MSDKRESSNTTASSDVTLAAALARKLESPLTPKQQRLANQIEAARRRLILACEPYDDPDTMRQAAELRVKHLATTTTMNVFQAFARVTRELRGI